MKKNSTKKTDQPKNNIVRFPGNYQPPMPVTRQPATDAPAITFEQAEGYRIDDMSLIGDGILAGDYLECQRQFSEITPKHICIVRVIPSGTQYCKHVHFNKNGTVTLKGSNSTYKDVVCRKEEIKILAIAIRAITTKDLLT